MLKSSDSAATGLGVPRDTVVVSWVRAASVQRQIWDRKYDFLRTGSGGAGAFGIIVDAVRAQLGTDPQWDPDKDSHREVWAALTPDERQIEILRTSTAPGVSRHHLGSDADFFDTPRRTGRAAAPCPPITPGCARTPPRRPTPPPRSARNGGTGPTHPSPKPYSTTSAPTRAWPKVRWRDYMYDLNETAYSGS
ncbi:MULTISPECIES: D-alanyl-D-alanine carboxypeptidase family protein [unclassified Streptomyces]|uniref:D-alanyl-D-alanine carboxypeptidase family protein n=1 Tax=unclassified Streptomyces TaxID=2593676 RepID=UPI0013A6B648|nr:MULTISPECIES: D-alanyl-D-alanine carboxypeptidase family protein [unclassified Streptomyces]QZZ25208.1 M15 family metallopeptidase [Streptomyces sp. ST1015]